MVRVCGLLWGGGGGGGKGYCNKTNVCLQLGIILCDLALI